MFDEKIRADVRRKTILRKNRSRPLEAPSVAYLAELKRQRLEELESLSVAKGTQLEFELETPSVLVAR